ncbi:UNVERIFIED_CONTAM: hypothetical protein RKD50_005008 [Streptomyces canus]
MTVADLLIDGGRVRFEGFEGFDGFDGCGAGGDAW